MSDFSIEALSAPLAGIDGVTAVVLGGSRARGDHRPDSDWDLGVYYRGDFDVDAVQALGLQGEFFRPGDWAGFMNGGAFVTVGDEKVDIIYRDLNTIDRCTAMAEEGRFEISRVPGYIMGMTSYVLIGELALCRHLSGHLPRPGFPEALRERGRQRWTNERDFALMFADAHAARGDVAACAGSLAQAVMSEGYGRLCLRAEWALNDKNVVERAGLTSVWSCMATLSDPVATVAEVRGHLEGG